MHARRIGLTADAFWSLTIRELYREFAAARLRAKDDYRRDVTLAVNIVAVYVKTKNDKRVPSVRSMLGPDAGDTKPTPQQRVKQVHAALIVLSEQYGIPLRKAGSRG